MSLRLGLADVAVVCSPGLTAQVMRDDRVFDKGGFFIDRSRELVGDGVATLMSLLLSSRDHDDSRLSDEEIAIR